MSKTWVHVVDVGEEEQTACCDQTAAMSSSTLAHPPDTSGSCSTHSVGKKKKKPGGGPRSCRDPSIRDTIPPKESSLPGGQRETAIFWLLILAHTEYEKRNRGSDVFVPITTISGWAFCKCNSPPHLANRQYVKGWPVLSKSMRGPKSVQLSCFLYQIIPTFPAQLLIHSHQRTLMDGWVSSLALFIFLHPHLPTPCNWAPTGYAMFCQTPTGLQGSEDLQMLG